MTKRPRARRGAVAIALAVVAAPVLILAPMSEAQPNVDDAWHLEAMKVAEAQEWSTGDGVVVAVIDTGVDASHPGLEGQVLEGATVSEDGVEPGVVGDPDGHGTAMAGLIAGDDSDGDVAGVAPGAEILPVRIDRDEDGTLDQELVYEGVRWAIDAGASVVNLSLAGKPTSDDGWKHELIQYAIDHNAVIVAAVGNKVDLSSEVGEPASIPGVVAVSGMSRDGGVWSGAVTGDAVVLCAPAEDLPHLRPGGGLHTASGTSAASALVSGTAALILSRYPQSSTGDVISRLINTADDMSHSAPGHGFGAVDAHAALTSAVAPGGEYFPLDLPEDVGQEAVGAQEMGGSWLAVSAATALGFGILAALWLMLRTRKVSPSQGDSATQQSA